MWIRRPLRFGLSGVACMGGEDGGAEFALVLPGGEADTLNTPANG